MWIRDNFSTDDYIIVNLDIEGAAFEVLEKMLQDGTIQYIDRLFVEFDSAIFIREHENYDIKENRLIEEIKKSGVSIENISLWNKFVEDIVNEGQWPEILE